MIVAKILIALLGFGLIVLGAIGAFVNMFHRASRKDRLMATLYLLSGVAAILLAVFLDWK